MALMNEILAGRFNQLLTRFFNIVGGAPSPQLASEVIPVMDLADPTPDTLILQAVRMCTGTIIATGAALKTNGVRLRNPVSSNVVVTLTDVTVQNTAAAPTEVTIGHGAIVTDLAQNLAAPGVQGRDTRALTKGAANMTWDNNAPAFFDPTLLSLTLPVNGIFTQPVPVVLSPGFGYDVVGRTVNSTLKVSMAWVERAMAPGEVGPF